MKGGRIFTAVLGLFFAAATFLLLVTGISMLWPGSVLDDIWALNPARRPELMAVRVLLGPGIFLLCVPMLAASIGSFKRRPWGRVLAMAIFAVNGIGDAVQLVLGRWFEGGIGIAVAGLLIVALWQARPAFDCGPSALAQDSRRL